MRALDPRDAWGLHPALPMTSTHIGSLICPLTCHHLPGRAVHRTGKIYRQARLRASKQQLLFCCLFCAATKVTPFGGNTAGLEARPLLPNRAFPLPIPTLSPAYLFPPRTQLRRRQSQVNGRTPTVLHIDQSVQHRDEHTGRAQ